MGAVFVAEEFSMPSARMKSASLSAVPHALTAFHGVPDFEKRYSPFALVIFRKRKR